MLALAVACCRSSTCPTGHRVESSEQISSCVDERGRYDGASWGTVERDGEKVTFRGSFSREAPAGRWTCERDGERLVIEYSPRAWEKELWGRSEPVAGIKNQRHIAPSPGNLCPAGDWASLEKNGFEVPELGSLEARGVAEFVDYRRQ